MFKNSAAAAPLRSVWCPRYTENLRGHVLAFALYPLTARCPCCDRQPSSHQSCGFAKIAAIQFFFNLFSITEVALQSSFNRLVVSKATYIRACLRSSRFGARHVALSQQSKMLLLCHERYGSVPWCHKDSLRTRGVLVLACNDLFKHWLQLLSDLYAHREQKPSLLRCCCAYFWQHSWRFTFSRIDMIAFARFNALQWAIRVSVKSCRSMR